VGASSTIYLGVYALIFMMTHLDLNVFAEDMIYLLWTSMFLVFYALFTGTCSALASMWFVNRIYDNFELESRK
jgi:hypothetical protein